MATKKAKKKASKKPAKSKKKKATKSGDIQARQWKLPASYCAGGEGMASLREVADPNVPTLAFSELTQQQRAELVAKRIEVQPKFQIVMLGAGLVDQQRAIAEVKAQTSVGRALMEIEQRVINYQVAKATAAAMPAPPKPSKATKAKKPAKAKKNSKKHK